MLKYITRSLTWSEVASARDSLREAVLKTMLIKSNSVKSDVQLKHLFSRFSELGLSKVFCPDKVSVRERNASWLLVKFHMFVTFDNV